MCRFPILIVLLICFINHAVSIQPPPQSFYEFESKYSEAQSAKDKFDSIWEMMTTTGTELPPYPNVFNFLKDLSLIPLIAGQNLRFVQSFSMFRSWRLDHKMLHTRPVHASVKMIFNNEAHEHYTGLFEADSVDYGIMSLSPGFKVPNMTNFFATSIRSFRDNVPASGIIAAFNVISLPNWNIFDYMICTHYNWLMAIPVVILGPTRVGQGWTQYFNQFGLSNLAEYKVNGEKVANPKFPWALCFVPNEILRKRFTGHKASGSAYELVHGIEAGDKLYDIWAIKEPYPLADPKLLMNYSHQIGELVTTSEFITSTYGAQRLLGSHQPFEIDLLYRPDWGAFATPYYLMRAGAVGAYSGLFPVPNPDIEQAQLNLMLVMTGIVRAFTTIRGFRNFLRQYGITPVQLYQSTVGYVIDFVIPIRLNEATRLSISPPFKIGPKWALNTIRNIALYVSLVGVHPPLGPLQISQLGTRKVEQGGDAVKLVESSLVGHDVRYTAEKQQAEALNNRTAPRIEGEMQDEIPELGGGHSSNRVDNQSSIQSCMKRLESSSSFNSNHNDLTIENTLFKDVRSLPFHIDIFNFLSSLQTTHF